MAQHWLRELHRRMTTANRRARPSRRPRFRPSLDTLEVRATPAVLTFQEGANSYAGTHDDEISSGSPTANLGNDVEMSIDLDNGGQTLGLLRFGNIFGSATNQIPLNSIINSATLRDQRQRRQ
jgi:hypothetical protein